jgi:hypothetical protein
MSSRFSACGTLSTCGEFFASWLSRCHPDEGKSSVQKKPATEVAGKSSAYREI